MPEAHSESERLVRAPTYHTRKVCQHSFNQLEIISPCMLRRKIDIALLDAMLETTGKSDARNETSRDVRQARDLSEKVAIDSQQLA